jgi:hypothetical protein
MNSPSIQSSVASPAEQLAALQEDSSLKQQQVQQYFMLSNSMSILFDHRQGIATQAALARPHVTAEGTPDVAAVPSIDDTPPQNSIQADLQAAGWLSFIDGLISHLNNPSALNSFNWAMNKLKALQATGMLDSDFATMTTKALAIFANPSTAPAQWANFWIIGTDANPGAIKTIDQNLSAWLNSSPQSMDNPDDDTMFGIIMLFNDLGQKPGAGTISSLAENFFGYSQQGEEAPAYAEYDRFIALYFWKHSSELNVTDAMAIIPYLDSHPDKTKSPFTYDFFYGDGSGVAGGKGLYKLMQDLTDQQWGGKWPSIDGVPSQIERWAKKDWADTISN